MKYGLSVGKSRLSPRVKAKNVSWNPSLRSRLLRIERTNETYSDYLEMSVAEQAAIKDVGYFVGGQYNGDIRKLSELRFRSLVTLDIDHLDPWDMGLVEETYGQYEYVLHSTHKHHPDTPRLRLVLPLSKPVKPHLYEPLARAVADMMGMEYFDDTTYQPSRVMFWGSAAADAEIIADANEGILLDPVEVLARYNDPNDFAEWPISTREGSIRQRTAISADPLTAPGVIGAFNRQFDIHAAIERFELPYEPTGHENRYRLSGSSGADGAIVYDDVFMYSHHESDPAGQKNCNAFDLVRIHKFGDWDADDEALDTPISRRPQFKEMAALAMAQPEVQQDMAGQEFGESPDVADPATPEEKKKAPTLTYPLLRHEIENLPKTKSEKDLQALVIKVAAARLDPIENDTLAAVLRSNWTDPAPQKGTILKEIENQAKRLTAKQADGGENNDIELLIINTILERHFEGGRTLKRFGKKFWWYRNGVWRMTDDEIIRSIFIKAMIELREERPEEVLQVVASIGESKTSTLTGQLWIMFCAYIAGRDLTDDPLHMTEMVKAPVINTLNCELWFNEQGEIEVRKHKPEHYHTYQINVLYEPEAECPGWDKLMALCFGTGPEAEDQVRHLEELIGYILQPSREHKIWLLLVGDGYNGKSTILALIGDMLGISSIEMSLADFGSNANDHIDTALVGKLLLVDDDFPTGAKLPDAFLKRASEAKRVTANPKYGDFFNFVSRALPTVLSNHQPACSDVSPAIKERAMVFYFDNYIGPEQRSEAARRALFEPGEMSGMLNRFAAGFARLKRRGHFKIPAACERARQRWINAANPMSMFIDETLVADKGSFIEVDKLWLAYTTWSRLNNPSGAKMKRGTLLERLDLVLGHRGKMGKEDVYPGYRFRYERTDDDKF